MTDRDPSSPKPITLHEKLASIDPARREKLDAEAEQMQDDLRKREAILDKLVEDAQANDMGY